MRRRTPTSLAAAIALLALAAPAEGARTVKYEGEVLDGRGTEFELTAEFRRGHPVALLSFESGRVILDCEAGEQLRRTKTNNSQELREDGSFQQTEHYVALPQESLVRRDRVAGAVHLNNTSGFLRIQTFDHFEKGDCDSGRLDWKAERIR